MADMDMDQNSNNTPPAITAWGIIKPYWVSEDRWRAWGLLARVIAMSLALVGLNVWFNHWYRIFYDAIQQYNYSLFIESILKFTVVAIVYILLSAYGTYFSQMLEFRWRQWLTEKYLRQWFSHRAYYNSERDGLMDNPDQRISNDLEALTRLTIDLSVGLLRNIANLAAFILILWKISGPLAFSVAGMHIFIPAYMVWAALVYAVLGSWLTYYFNRRLVPINYQQQRVEADFRFGLIRVRENAEPIAMYRGEEAEQDALKGVFGHIRNNWRLVMRFTRRLGIVQSSYGQLAIVFPYLMAAPRYFTKQIALGDYTAIANAFGNVSSSASWFINNYDSLATWRATVNRLREFHRVMQAQQSEALEPENANSNIQLNHAATPSIATRSLKLTLPDGTPLAPVRDIDITPGSRWLVRGPSGAGKSTFMRALAGLWPFGDGRINLPDNAQMMFVPQQNYLPIGTLKAALAYPSPAQAFSDAACRDALNACGLAEYAARLGEAAHWSRTLSPGEQQRLAGARALLHQPDYLFLDEATSALDANNEARLYRALTERLPQTAIVSIAHRTSVAQFHQETLDIGSAMQ